MVEFQRNCSFKTCLKNAWKNFIPFSDAKRMALFRAY